MAGGVVRRFIKRLTVGYGLLSGALPDFWLGLLLIFIFFTTLGWAPPPEGRLGIGEIPPPHVTGFYTIDSLLAGQWDTFVSAVTHLVLPVITLALVYGGAILKVTGLTVGRALRGDYTAFEEGLGLSSRQVLVLALRNSAPPIIVMTGIVVGYLLGGAVLVETVFNLNGIGQYAVNAVTSADYAPIQAFVLIAGALHDDRLPGGRPAVHRRRPACSDGGEAGMTAPGRLRPPFDPLGQGDGSASWPRCGRWRSSGSLRLACFSCWQSSGR